MRLLAIVAVGSFLATFPLSRAAESARCIETVRAVRTPSGTTVGEAVAADDWRFDRGTDRVRALGPGGEVLGEWSCSDDAVPLVLAIDDAARTLTPDRYFE